MKIDVVGREGCIDGKGKGLVYMEAQSPGLLRLGGVEKVVCLSLVRTVATRKTEKAGRVCMNIHRACLFLDGDVPVDVAVLDEQVLLVRRP